LYIIIKRFFFKSFYYLLIISTIKNAFDGGIFRVGGEGLRYGLIGGQREKVRGEYGFEFARRERVLSSRAEGRMKVRVG
jgi:hypothetical protein